VQREGDIHGTIGRVDDRDDGVHVGMHGSSICSGFSSRPVVGSV
jgi:hypothetical protein